MCSWERRDEPATQQGSWNQTMQSELCPAARFSLELQLSLESGRQGLLHHLKPKGCFSKSTRQRKANAAAVGCSEAGLGSAGHVWEQQRGYCNPQPRCSSKTIAGLMHTPDDVRDTAQTTAAAWTRGSRASGEQRDSKGNSFVIKCTSPKTTGTFPLLKSSSSRDATQQETSKKFKYWPSTN